VSSDRTVIVFFGASPVLSVTTMSSIAPASISRMP